MLWKERHGSWGVASLSGPDLWMRCYVHILSLAAAWIEYSAARHANDVQVERGFSSSKRDIKGYSGKKGMRAGPSCLYLALIFG